MTDIIKIFAPAVLAFAVGIAMTPMLTHYLFHFKVWKKTPGKYALDGTAATEFNKLHKENEAHTPRMGGIVIWGSVFVTTLACWAIAFFMLMTLALYASGVIDGIDGLSGGVFASIFTAYSVIAFSQQQFDLAAFCATVAGAILAFLWFNIPPARFWMTETGTMALTLTLAVVVFMSDNLGTGHGIAVLPIIGFPLVAPVLSDVIQIIAKKFWKRKVFRVAPLHHHFEALGWPGYKVTMRYWVISIICAIIGMTIAITA